MAERRLARIQDNGQITLPAESRRRRGVKKGDVVAITETADGWLITPQRVVPAGSAEQPAPPLAGRQALRLDEVLAPHHREWQRLLTEQYPDVASLRGMAGSLDRPLGKKELLDIAREDALGAVSTRSDG